MTSCLEGANKVWYIGVCTYIERKIVYKKTKLVRTMTRGSTETVQTIAEVNGWVDLRYDPLLPCEGVAKKEDITEHPCGEHKRKSEDILNSERKTDRGYLPSKVGPSAKC